MRKTKLPEGEARFIDRAIPRASSQVKGIVKRQRGAELRREQAFAAAIERYVRRELAVSGIVVKSPQLRAICDRILALAFQELAQAIEWRVGQLKRAQRTRAK